MPANRDTVGGGSGGADASGYSLGASYYGITPVGGNIGYANGIGQDSRAGGNWNTPATAAQYSGWLGGTAYSPYTGANIYGVTRDTMASMPPSWQQGLPQAPAGLLGPTPAAYAVPPGALSPEPVAPATPPLADMPTMAGAIAPMAATLSPAQQALVGEKQSVVQKYDPASEAGAQRLAKMSLAEARGEGALGMQAVMDTAVNRADDNWYGRGSDPVSQAYSPGQYSGVWDHNAAAADRELAADTELSRMAVDMGREAMAGNLVDITGGARSFRVADQPTDRVHQSLEQKGYTDIGSHRFSDFNPAQQTLTAPMPPTRPADLGSAVGAVRSWANPQSTPAVDPGFQPSPTYGMGVQQGVPLADISPRAPAGQLAGATVPAPVQRAYDPLSSVRAPSVPDAITYSAVPSERVTPPSVMEPAGKFTDRLTNPNVPHTMTAAEYADQQAERERMAADEAAQMDPAERARRQLAGQLADAYQQTTNPWTGQPNDPEQTAIALGQFPDPSTLAPVPPAPLLNMQPGATPFVAPVAPIAAVPLPPTRPTLPERPTTPETPAAPRLTIEKAPPLPAPAEVKSRPVYNEYAAGRLEGEDGVVGKPHEFGTNEAKLEGQAQKAFHKTPLGMGLTVLANAIAGSAFPPAAPILAATSLFGVNPFQMGLDYMTGDMEPQKVTEPLPDFGRGRGAMLTGPQRDLVAPLPKKAAAKSKSADDWTDPGIYLPLLDEWSR